MCNSPFQSVNSKAKYCSQKCKSKYYRYLIYTEKGKTHKIQRILLHFPCMNCGWNEGPRDVHHIIPVSEGGKNEINNMITLCPNCHRLAHRNLLSKEKLFILLKNWTISSSSKEEMDAISGN
jgi:5-methylcytosine-specific restriction endonuclease McrA